MTDQRRIWVAMIILFILPVTIAIALLPPVLAGAFAGSWLAVFAWPAAEFWARKMKVEGR